MPSQAQLLQAMFYGFDNAFGVSLYLKYGFIESTPVSPPTNGRPDAAGQSNKQRFPTVGTVPPFSSAIYRVYCHFRQIRCSQKSSRPTNYYCNLLRCVQSYVFQVLVEMRFVFSFQLYASGFDILVLFPATSSSNFWTGSQNIFPDFPFTVCFSLVEELIRKRVGQENM